LVSQLLKPFLCFTFINVKTWFLFPGIDLCAVFWQMHLFLPLPMLLLPDAVFTEKGL